MTTKRIYTPEEAVESLKKLPENARKLIYSKEMRDILMKIGEKNKLHLDQIALLEAETGAVMLGFTDTQDYVSMLVDNVRVDQTTAEAIAKDINEQLFLKIRESMKGTPQSTPAPAPASKPIEPHPADLMLTQKTVTTAPTNPTSPEASKGATPKPYKADPYREPTN